MAFVRFPFVRLLLPRRTTPKGVMCAPLDDVIYFFVMLRMLLAVRRRLASLDTKEFR